VAAHVTTVRLSTKKREAFLWLFQLFFNQNVSHAPSEGAAQTLTELMFEAFYIF